MIFVTDEAKKILKEIMVQLNQTPKDAETAGFLKKLRENLRARLLYLHTYACYNEDKLDIQATRCTLCSDFAPFSFGFGMAKRGGVLPVDGYTRWFAGGLIFNASADFPTLTCSLSDSVGWSVNT